MGSFFIPSTNVSLNNVSTQFFTPFTFPIQGNSLSTVGSRRYPRSTRLTGSTPPNQYGGVEFGFIKQLRSEDFNNPGGPLDANLPGVRISGVNVNTPIPFSPPPDFTTAFSIQNVLSDFIYAIENFAGGSSYEVTSITFSWNTSVSGYQSSGWYGKNDLNTLGVLIDSSASATISTSIVSQYDYIVHYFSDEFGFGDEFGGF